MNIINKIFILSLVLFCHSLAMAQFITLTPTISKKAENTIIKERVNQADNLKPKNEKKFLEKVFNITTKADLKNELDSLKEMIKEKSSSNNIKWNFKKTLDSSALASQSNIFYNIQNNKNRFTEYDYVLEPKKVNFSKIVMPLNREISITSFYGKRSHPIFRKTKFHDGIDLAANFENVYSVLDGIVTEIGWDYKGGGNYIKVKHFNRFETAYLHLSEIYYRVGEFVKAGYIIAKSGNSGNSTGPHLHFSVKEFGQSINPTHFLNDLIKVNQLITTYYAK